MKKVIIYTDGAARGNPGPAGAGVVFCNEKKQPIKKYGKYLGDNLTNNEAEYKAVIFALQKFKAVFSKKVAKETEIKVKSDSQLLVNQIEGKYKIENERIGKLFLEIWNLKQDFKKVKFKQVKREKNEDADRLANEAIDREEGKQSLFKEEN
ncbi:MAG: ribonuclease HI family protein [Minisyncoccales bacterium]